MSHYSRKWRLKTQFGNPCSRSLILGFPGAPVQLEESDLPLIPFLVFFDEPAPDGSCYRGTTVAAASDQEFDAWIQHIASGYLLNEAECNDRRWPMGGKLALCNRLWKHGEVWGLTYSCNTDEDMKEGD